MEHTAEMEKQYKISEMTRFVNVEAHVLRYWEEELQLPIKRNELGHRYYTQDDKDLFLKVKQLKEKGIQLKGIRAMLDITGGKTDSALQIKSVRNLEPEITFSNDKEDKSYRLQLLLKGLVQEAVEESNIKLAADIKECLVKELDYQFRVAGEEQEQQRKEYAMQQEEYFRKLDEAIQNSRYAKKKKMTKWLQPSGK